MAFATSVHAKAIELIKLSIEMTTAAGSGHPTSAASLALAARLDEIDKRIFCLIGDGESREGQIWEAVDFVADYRLTALCPIVNCNGYGQADRVSLQQSPNVTAAKLRGAGFDVQIIDGHNPMEIRQALGEHTAHSQNPTAKPFAIVARTIKGWGFSSVLGSHMHGQPVPQADKDKALAALDAMAQQVGAAWTAGDLRTPPLPVASPPRAEPARPAPTFTEALQRFGREQVLETGKLATRKAYGLALQALGHANPHIVALDGDLRNSTYSEYFYDDAALRQRFLECKIAEQ